MRYVLDSSVAFKWEVPEVDSDKAIRFRDETRRGLHQLVAPDVFPVEVAHAMTRAERQGRVSPADGWRLWLAIMTDTPTLHSYIPLVPRAYAISSAVRVGVYDCLYVALAEREGCEFVTADARSPTSGRTSRSSRNSPRSPDCTTRPVTDRHRERRRMPARLVRIGPGES
jgi:predicted nucleic acid-binding protein